MHEKKTRKYIAGLCTSIIDILYYIHIYYTPQLPCWPCNGRQGLTGLRTPSGGLQETGNWTWPACGKIQRDDAVCNPTKWRQQQLAALSIPRFSLRDITNRTRLVSLTRLTTMIGVSSSSSIIAAINLLYCSPQHSGGGAGNSDHQRRRRPHRYAACPDYSRTQILLTAFQLPKIQISHIVTKLPVVHITSPRAISTVLSELIDIRSK